MTKRAKSDKFMIPKKFKTTINMVRHCTDQKVSFSLPFIAVPLCLFVQLHIYLSIVACEEEMRAILVAPTSDPILTSALKHDSQISLIL